MTRLTSLDSRPRVRGQEDNEAFKMTDRPGPSNLASRDLKVFARLQQILEYSLCSHLISLNYQTITLMCLLTVFTLGAVTAIVHDYYSIGKYSFLPRIWTSYSPM